MIAVIVLKRWWLKMNLAIRDSEAHSDIYESR